MRRRFGRWILAALLAVAAACLLVASYLGYFASDAVKLIQPADRRGDAKVVFLSSDMGLNAGMGPKIVEQLAASGLPVVGLNSLTFFRHERTPEEVVTLVHTLIERADRQFGPGPIILIGQSFGADALQLGLAGIASEDRKSISLVVLIVPTATVYLRASPAEMLNFTPADRLAIDTARTIDWVPLVCIYGAEEEQSLCPLLSGGNVSKIAIPGGHYLDRNAELVAQTIERKIGEELR